MALAPVSGFPIYKKTRKALYAFTAEDKMYKIEKGGMKTDNGLTIAYYNTRRKVVMYWQEKGDVLTKEEFKKHYASLTSTVLDNILNHH